MSQLKAFKIAQPFVTQCTSRSWRCYYFLSYDPCYCRVTLIFQRNINAIFNLNFSLSFLFTNLKEDFDRSTLVKCFIMGTKSAEAFLKGTNFWKTLISNVALLRRNFSKKRWLVLHHDWGTMMTKTSKHEAAHWAQLWRVGPITLTKTFSELGSCETGKIVVLWKVEEPWATL